MESLGVEYIQSVDGLPVSVCVGFSIVRYMCEFGEVVSA